MGYEPSENIMAKVMAKAEIGPVTMSESLDMLAQALAKAQLELSQPKKTKTVDMVLNSGRRVTYKYAELADSLESLKVLNRNGIAVSQPFSVKEGVLTITTILLHESGQFIKAPCSWPITDADPKKAGSLITYLRRYALSIAGIAAEEDNDSQTHSPSDEEKAPTSKVLPRQTPQESPHQELGAFQKPASGPAISENSPNKGAIKLASPKQIASIPYLAQQHGYDIAYIDSYIRKVYNKERDELNWKEYKEFRENVEAYNIDLAIERLEAPQEMSDNEIPF